MRTMVKLLPLLLLLGLTGSVLAQGDGGPPDIPIQVFSSQDGIVAGGKMRIAVVYEVPARYHIQINEFLYANPPEGGPLDLGAPILTPTRKWEGEPILAGRTIVIYDATLAAGTPLGEPSLKLLVGYQACVEEPVFACFPPEEREITLTLRVVASGAEISATHASYFSKAPPPESGETVPPTGATDAGALEPVRDQPPTGQPGLESPTQPAATPGSSAGSPPPQGGSIHEGLAARLREALEHGSWIAFLLVFIAGFLTSFTPCVYPMIPITIGYVAGASRGRLSGFVLSLFFVLGIAVVYSALGVAAALSGGIFGAALQSKAALIVIASVFVMMGASMLGAFDLSIPSSLQTKLQSGRRGGWIGAVLMGGITGLVASPCVGPVLVVLLTWVAQVGRPLYGFGLLFTFALGLGLLFLVLGTFVGAMKGLPRAGAWMETVKHYFGWIFLGLAAFYLRTVIGPTWATILYGALLIVLATQTGAFTPLTAEAGKGAHWRKGIGIVLAVLGTGMMLSGIFTQYGWRATGSTGPFTVGQQTVSGSVAWRTDEGPALARARAEGRAVLIDFTAEWCAACHELDRETWTDPEVARELADFVALRIDLTRNTPENDAIRDRWKVAGLPTVIVLNGDGGEVERFFGFRPPEQVLPLLRRAG
jgi:thioredoxin:protein disulfide reductase